MAIHYTFSLDRLERLYVDEIVKLYEVPVNIVSDQDVRFTYRFWLRLQKALAITLHLNTAIHP